MILLIDNYDSFTYNLYQYLSELGAEVVVRRNDKITIGEIEQMAPECIVVSPGPCTPAEAGISVDVFRRFSGEIPLLGVCLGHQSMAVAFGGDVVRAPSLMHGKISSISHDGRGLFSGIPNPFIATRYHSLIVDEETLPACLEVSARSEHGLIMGLRHRTLDVEGVQFHPESILTAVGKDLLSNFLGRPAPVLAARGY
jgi:anthranilate synthase/aminodeoxychorismate synthase-like glutamine amidotransferase